MNYTVAHLAVIFLSLLCSTATANTSFISLCYHDVRKDVAEKIDADQFAISTDKLIEHFNWLRAHDYTVVSLAQIIAAREGKQALPEKAVLLTFDDGYASVYHEIFPVLKLFNYPALIALVGSWLEVADGDMVAYGNRLVPREKFLSWEQIAELDQSPLITFASHSYDLHRGIHANPQGNSEPAATTRMFNPTTDRYESADAYIARIRADLARNIKLMTTHGLAPPRVMVWPYGRYNQTSKEIARALGMTISLTLDATPNRLPFDVGHRYLIVANPSIGEIVEAFRPPRLSEKLRIAQIDMDYLYDSNPAQIEANLGSLLDRIKALEISIVFLQAYADPDGDDSADALYFPNRHLPMRADLFNRVAWQLSTRAGVKVFAWLPISAFQLPDGLEKNAALNVEALDEKKSSGPLRWSIFAPAARDMIKDIYADLGSYSGGLDGILFHDDGVLGDFEDNSTHAINAYKAAGFAASISEIRAHEESLRRWTRFKTHALVDFTNELAAILRATFPELKTARSLFAQTILNPESQTWYAQDLDTFLRHYDYPIVMAMPYMEAVDDPNAWLKDLVRAAKQYPGALDRTVFQLQTVDWRDSSRVSLTNLAEQFDALRLNGVRHMAYYPDDYIAGEPAVAAFRRVISKSDFFPASPLGEATH